jgi:peptidoglycan/xylan/chitin deacetylase (PgdA/CDA1 family)
LKAASKNSTNFSFFLKIKKFLLKLRGRALGHQVSYALPRIFFFLALFIAISALFRHLCIGGEIKSLEREVWFYVAGGGFFFIFLAGFISYFEYHGIGPQEGIIRRGPDLKVVALTFDDGPSPKYTPKVLDILKKEGVKATFFLVGKHVEKYPVLAKRIVEEGHEIGNHTYSHRDLVPATKRVVINEVKKAERVIENACGVRPLYFRPPRGIYSNAVRKLILDLDYTILLWSLSSLDWSGASPKLILNRVKKYVRRGSIILFHDSGALIKPEGGSRENMVKALPEVIKYLKSEGYKLVTISELISLLEKPESFMLEEVYEGST